MKKTWLVPIVLAGGVFAVSQMASGCLSKDPDQKLAGRFDDLCDIAGDGIDQPLTGVKKLGRYLGTHTDDILGELGGTIQLIERISDDEAHDARAYVARERIQKPLIECASTWNEFGDAIEADPAALELLQHGADRVGRTLEIIFGEGGKGKLEIRDLRHLPTALMHRFDSLAD